MVKDPASEEKVTQMLKIPLPEALIARVNTFCNGEKITIQEFIIDAIVSKLELVYKERRRKPRL